MLVDINLLPQKPKRSLKAIIITASIIFTALTLLVIGYFIHESKLQKLANVNNEIEMVVKLRELAEQMVEEATPTDTVDELQQKINWVYSQQISTVYLLNYFVSLLPQRGFFMNYQYNDQGTISVTIQFDSPREAASYLNKLNQSSYVEKATLSQLSISEVIDEREEQDDVDRFQYLPRYIGHFSIEVDRERVIKTEGEGGSE